MKKVAQQNHKTHLSTLVCLDLRDGPRIAYMVQNLAAYIPNNFFMASNKEKGHKWKKTLCTCTNKEKGFLQGI